MSNRYKINIETRATADPVSTICLFQILYKLSQPCEDGEKYCVGLSYAYNSIHGNGFYYRMSPINVPKTTHQTHCKTHAR
jgi:hypothetical protein